jgi:hypothetical protein
MEGISNTKVMNQRKENRITEVGSNREGRTIRLDQRRLSGKVGGLGKIDQIKTDLDFCEEYPLCLSQRALSCSDLS